MATLRAGMLFSSKPTHFHEKYTSGFVIGTGSYGKVLSCKEKVTNTSYACKVVEKSLSLDAKTRQEAIKWEADIMAMLKGGHPGTVQLREVIESGGQVYLVMEMCKGGDLYNLLTTKGKLPEHSAKSIFRQLISALAFCHKKGIIHRDIKPENVLLDRPASSLYLPLSTSKKLPQVQAKLADFGVSALVSPGQAVSGYTGSRFYVAPEVVRGEAYSSAVDMWSMGVLLCAMLTGRVPFAGKGPNDKEGLKQAIVKGDVDFSSSMWAGVSAQAKELVKAMLRLDPKLRPQARDVLFHSWCVDNSLPDMMVSMYLTQLKRAF